MFGAARDPFAFIRNGIRLHSTEEWRGKKVAGRIRFILSSLVLVDGEMERSAARDGRSGVRGAGGREQGQRIPRGRVKVWGPVQRVRSSSAV